jgi:20S proteasome subunit beta 1
VKNSTLYFTDHGPRPNHDFDVALALAMSRDGSSGGTIRMCVITEDAVERIFIPGDKLPRFWEGYMVGTAAKKLASNLETAPMAVET